MQRPQNSEIWTHIIVKSPLEIGFHVLKAGECDQVAAEKTYMKEYGKRKILPSS